jgi:hypothetical protein
MNEKNFFSEITNGYDVCFLQQLLIDSFYFPSPKEDRREAKLPLPLKDICKYSNLNDESQLVFLQTMENTTTSQLLDMLQHLLFNWCFLWCEVILWRIPFLQFDEVMIEIVLDFAVTSSGVTPKSLHSYTPTGKGLRNPHFALKFKVMLFQSNLLCLQQHLLDYAGS